MGLFFADGPITIVPMSKFTEINYQGSLRGEKAHDYMWGVHVEGCGDIEREIIRQFGRNVVKDGSVDYITTSHEASSLRELLDKIVDGETRDLGWGDENVKVHNCVTKAFRAAKERDGALKVAAQIALDNIAKDAPAIEATLNAMMPKADATGRRHGVGGRFVAKK